MEKFIVSARKYRPQTFDTVVGQQHITTTLKNAIRNEQLAHAFLFCGPGVLVKQPVPESWQKQSTARILLKTGKPVTSVIPASHSMRGFP
jgi:DNA polymerase III gamma/tau subunit